MKRVIVITGTPGAGKTTLAKKVAAKMKGCEAIDANEIVKKNKLFSSYASDGAMIVKMAPLKKAIEKRIHDSKAQCIIIEGHLLCDIKIKGAVAVVVREDLGTLLKRFRERGYKGKKVEDNIVSEAIDYCGVRAANNYETVYEIKGGSGALAKVMSLAKGNKIKQDNIDSLEELNAILGKIN